MTYFPCDVLSAEGDPISRLISHPAVSSHMKSPALQLDIYMHARTQSLMATWHHSRSLALWLCQPLPLPPGATVPSLAVLALNRLFLPLWLFLNLPNSYLWFYF